MDVDTNYDINRTAEFILSRNFTGVALQFPDELLKDSIKIVSALRNKIRSLREGNDEQKEIRLFVMADTTYGSCCVDEVGASHIDADCVIHYGHTCLSPTSTLPAYFVFGKASINTSRCYENLLNYTSTSEKPILVLYGLEYAYSIPHIREKLLASSKSCDLKSKVDIHFADVRCSTINPLEDPRNSCGSLDMASDTRYSSGGLIWDVPKGHKMDDYFLFWIGPDNSAFANVVLTFNSCEIVRYDAMEDHLVKDVSQLKRILKRRYYLVEKAKDANMVGILVGTLGVAGYLHMIHQMKELIMAAGKKAYVFVMGRPNPAKLANFPECDVFVYVSCAQTALLDSKEFLAPIITPFEAMLAFSSGSQWTGEYVMEFRDLISSAPIDVVNQPEEARYSFLKGGYVEDANVQESTERDDDGTLSLANATERALQLRDVNSNKLGARPKSGAEFFLTRSYHGLEMDANNSLPEPFVIGRSGKASGYKDETTGA